MFTSLVSELTPLSVDSIHERAKEVAFRYKRTEVELIEVLQQIEDYRVFLRRGHSSLFSYVTSELGISESVTYNLICIARKSREIPELKSKLESGEMTLSNARRIVPVLTVANQDEWISKASELSNRKLEKEVAGVKPEVRTSERASYVSHDRVKLQFGLSERSTLKLRRAQDLLCQKRKRAVSLEETLEVLTSEFLHRNDPIEKAKRHVARQLPAGRRLGPAPKTRKPSQSLKTLVTRRVPLPSHILHQVNLRDERRCAFKLPNGNRCTQTRWIEIHHKNPVSKGGKNELDNLITLCSSHHDFEHLNAGTKSI